MPVSLINKETEFIQIYFLVWLAFLLSLPVILFFKPRADFTSEKRMEANSEVCVWFCVGSQLEQPL